nr:uncharacterized protein LOC129267427 [Lytechinus pictus]
MVTVEVGSTPKDITLINIDNFINYQATCDAIGSKPQETITWILDGVVQTEGIVETDPDSSPDPLFDLRSVFTFPASLDNYNVILVCMIGGHHSGSSLDRQESRRVDVQISCDPNDVVPAAIPPMNSFYIYSNGSLLTKESVSATSVEVTEPDYDTEYTCVGGNYLGNTTATQLFYPSIFH